MSLRRTHAEDVAQKPRQSIGFSETDTASRFVSAGVRWRTV
jgi:hypothetical protein